MPNKSAKHRKQIRRKKNEELNRTGRTSKQITKNKKKRENNNGTQRTL
jgi:hypothetical protein|tara:strand:- start:6509 stop:6652 length:144 start_codon:yes stop_codon:yes gene_type:complete